MSITPYVSSSLSVAPVQDFLDHIIPHYNPILFPKGYTLYAVLLEKTVDRYTSVCSQKFVQTPITLQDLKFRDQPNLRYHRLRILFYLKQENNNSQNNHVYHLTNEFLHAMNAGESQTYQGRTNPSIVFVQGTLLDSNENLTLDISNYDSNSSISQLEKKSDEAVKKIEEVLKRNEELKSELESSKKLLNESEENIKKRDKIITRKKKVISDYEQDFQEKDKKIDELIEEKGRLDKEVNRFQDENEKLKKELASQRKIIKKYKAEIYEYQQDMIEDEADDLGGFIKGDDESDTDTSSEESSSPKNHDSFRKVGRRLQKRN